MPHPKTNGHRRRGGVVRQDAGRDAGRRRQTKELKRTKIKELNK